MVDGLGLWLRRARENRQLSLADIERELKIRSRYLQALELGDYATLPGVVQARGFLRNYARYLGLPVEEAIARYEAEISGNPLQPRDMSPSYGCAGSSGITVMGAACPDRIRRNFRFPGTGFKRFDEYPFGGDPHLYIDRCRKFYCPPVSG